MLHKTYIALLVLATFGGSCNKQSVSLSNRDTEETQDGNGIDAEVVSPPEEITVETVSAPTQWPKCWLSYRLSIMTSFHIAGSRGDTWVESKHTPEAGRHEFKGESKNPTTSGKCTLNWFAQDYSKEPWVALFKQEFPNYRAVISCTATPTPDCLCASTLPVVINDFYESEERCVHKTADGNYKLYGVHERSDNQTVPAAGRCDATFKAVGDIARANLGVENFKQQTKDRQEMGGAGQTCRTDIEPFAPLPDEKDWYANEIRDWGITTCTDQNTGCRCYSIYNKSGYKEGARSGMFEHETCLLCKNGTCQLAKQ